MPKDTGYDNWMERQFEDPAFRLAYNTERACVEFTDQILDAIESKRMSKADLARKTGHSRAYITQTLKRGVNLTIKTMVELADACGYDLHIVLKRKNKYSGVVQR